LKEIDLEGGSYHMFNRTSELIGFAKQFIEEQNQPQLVFAYAGGSVGRGEADEYSDLDLNLWLEGESVSEASTNITFSGVTIQLHTHPVPDVAEVLANPWSYRFLREARLVYDPLGVFQKLKQDFLAYTDSEEGRGLMSSQAKQVVERRLLWMRHSLSLGQRLTAGIACNAAWIDAAFRYAFLQDGLLSTGGLLPWMRRTVFFEPYIDIVIPMERDPNEALLALRNYRAYLRDTAGNRFSLEAVQDNLAEGKTRRWLERKDPVNALWQLQTEAFWCFHTSVSGSFDQHYTSVPDKIRQALDVLGFREYREDEFDKLEQLVGEMVRG
jgi:hypothetical protein